MERGGSVEGDVGLNSKRVSERARNRWTETDFRFFLPRGLADKVPVASGKFGRMGSPPFPKTFKEITSSTITPKQTTCL
eukprot:766710-Hanusia_phi.AAC.9